MAGYKNSEIAKKVGMTQQGVSNAIRRHKKPSDITLFLTRINRITKLFRTKLNTKLNTKPNTKLNTKLNTIDMNIEGLSYDNIPIKNSRKHVDRDILKQTIEALKNIIKITMTKKYKNDSLQQNLLSDLIFMKTLVVLMEGWL